MKGTSIKANDPLLVELSRLRTKLKKNEDEHRDIVEKLQKRDAELKKQCLEDPEYSSLLKAHQENEKENGELMSEFSNKMDNLISIAEVTNEQPKEQE